MSLGERVAIPLFSLMPLAFVGCSDADPPPERVSVQLLSLDSCDDVADRLRANAIAAMEQAVQRQYEVALESGNCWGDEDGAAGGDGGEPPAIPDEGAADYSETNNQVDGVDEPDFVKNDDEYIYVVANNAFRIIDAWPAEDAHALVEVPIEGDETRLFVSGDRALIYSALGPPASGGDDYYPDHSGDACTYGYQCDFSGDGRSTKITVLSLADRSQPVVEREIYLSGSFITARRIGPVVHTVTSTRSPSFPEVGYWPEEIEYCRTYSPQVLSDAFRRLRRENRAIIERTPLDDLVPTVREVVRDDKGERDVLHGETCSGAYATGLADGAAVTSVFSLELDSPSSVSVASVVSRAGAVYASADSLYMAVPHEALGGAWYDGYDDEPQLSSVHRFALQSSGPHAVYAGSGVVKGRVLNQFAMDEYEGDLRIATTTGWTPDPDVHSTLTILRDTGDTLEEIGRVDDIAPTEDIRSVRFDGDHGFLVTFKKTDPLFALDLTPPEAPRVVGELKIPGFSTYMHLMDEDHLLTIGYDAADQGDFAWFTGILLQIFDVQDLTRPSLVFKETIGTRGSSSEALTNHLAFNYYPVRESLALPVTVCEGGDENGGYAEEIAFSGLKVFHVTAEDGFSLTGQVAHEPSEEIGCWNWWTDASSQVKRSVFMENYVYSISPTRLKVNSLESLSTDLVEVSLSE